MQIRIPNPNPLTQLNADPIRAGSETLKRGTGRYGYHLLRLEAKMQFKNHFSELV
jgi:hypothetical protein